MFRCPPALAALLFSAIPGLSAADGADPVKALQAQEQAARVAVADSDAVAGERSAVTAAEAAWQSFLAEDETLVAAREALADAAVALEALVIDKVARHKDIVGGARAHGERAAKRAALRQEDDLLRLSLEHPGSPLVAHLADDEALAAANAALADIEAANTAPADPALALARDQLRRSRDELVAQAGLLVAEEVQAERAAALALRTAERQAESPVGAARKALQAARSAALAAHGPAKKPLAEQAKVIDQIRALEHRQRGLEEARKALQAHLAPAETAAAVTAAKAALVEAQQAAAPPVAKAVAAAQATYEQVYTKHFAEHADYQALEAAGKKLEAKSMAAGAALAEAKGEQAILAAIDELADLRHQSYVNYHARRDMRVVLDDLDAAWHVRSGLQNDLRNATAGANAVTVAKAALVAAEQAHRQAVDAVLDEHPVVAVLDRQAAAIGQELAALDYRRDHLALILEGRHSPIRAAVEASPAVVAARAALARAEREWREQPPAKVAAARQALAQAQAAKSAAMAKARQQLAVADAETALKAVERQLRQGGGGEVEALKAARITRDQARRQAIASNREAAAAAARRQAIAEELHALDAADKAARELPAKVREEVVSKDRQVANLRQAMVQAQERIGARLASAEAAELREAIATARTALAKALAKAQDADPQVTRLRAAIADAKKAAKPAPKAKEGKNAKSKGKKAKPAQTQPAD